MARPKKRHYEYVPQLGRYRARIKDADGKRIAIYGRTEAELEEKILAAQDRLESLAACAADPLVKDYASTWLKRKTAPLRPKYAGTFTNAVNKHIIPAIGDRRLREIRPSDCQDLMNTLADKSASLCQKVRVSLQEMMESAVDEKLIPDNPARKLKNPGKRPARKQALTPAQQKTLLEAVSGLRVETFVMLALYAGLRREEALALRWDCVHLSEPAHIEVRRALRWEHNRPIVSDEMKTDAAFRIVPMAQELADHLRGLTKMTGYVIGGDNPLTETAFKRMWDQMLSRKAGEHTYKDKDGKHTFVAELGAKSRGGNFHYTIDFDVTPHVLRHTYVSNLIAGGVNPKTAQYLMGHTDAEFTLEVYTHLIDHSPAALAASLSDYYKTKTG